MTCARALALAAGIALGCTGNIEPRKTFGDADPQRGDPHPGPEGDVPLPPEPIDPDPGPFLEAPPAGWTEVDQDFKVQNWTQADIDDRFTQRGGEYRTEVHAGESRVEMRWEDWEDQDREHLWTGDVRIERGSTRTAVMQIKTYQLRIQWKGHSTRGIARFMVDGDELDEPLDQYAPDQSYATTTVGAVTFGDDGNHRIRMQVAGQNATSGGFILSADRFSFTRLP